MHQQQWLAVVEELGREASLPIPNSHPQSEEHRQFSYVFLGTMKDGSPPPQGRWTSGPSLDGKGTFTAEVARPHGQEPKLDPPRPGSGAQSEQMTSVAGLTQGLAEAAREVGAAITGKPKR
jgi:Mn-containing catalase